MRIAVYTSNQPRHLRLIERLCEVADEVCAVMECTTLFPGQVDDFYRKSPAMQTYFGHVMEAERKLFGQARLLPARARVMALKMGDLNGIEESALGDALSCDVQVVFGASYIKGPLVDRLIERRALNIHMGVSPYYRGSGCNFWAVHDGHADLVGATIHLLSRGLDSGAMLFHALPPREACDPFDLGMRAVDASQTTLAALIANGAVHRLEPVAQDRRGEIRYSRYADFTDDVVQRYLAAMPDARQIGRQFSQAPPREFLITAPR